MAQKSLFDRNTLIIFGFVLLLALSVFLFKWFSKPSCPEVKFSVVSSEITEGNPIYFKDETSGATSWEWNFGDGDSSDLQSIANPSHVFEHAGEYTVSLRVNGCSGSEEFQKITVASAVIATLDTILPVGGISGPAQCKVGQKVTYKDTTDAGTSWAWSFGESGTTDATEKEASYVFKQPGVHTVSLVINGRSNTATVKVLVKPVPATNTGGGGGGGGSVKKAPSISEAEFIKKLYDIISNKEKSAHIFDPYMCSYINMIVKVNGEDKDFSSYCKGLSISGQSTIQKIVSVRTIVDPSDGCITSVSIEQVNKKEED